MNSSTADHRGVQKPCQQCGQCDDALTCNHWYCKLGVHWGNQTCALAALGAARGGVYDSGCFSAALDSHRTRGGPDRPLTRFRRSELILGDTLVHVPKAPLAVIALFPGGALATRW